MGETVKAKERTVTMFTSVADIIGELARAGFTAESMSACSSAWAYRIEVSPLGIVCYATMPGAAPLFQLIEWDDFNRPGVIIDALVSMQATALS